MSVFLYVFFWAGGGIHSIKIGCFVVCLPSVVNTLCFCGLCWCSATQQSHFVIEYRRPSVTRGHVVKLKRGERADGQGREGSV